MANTLRLIVIGIASILCVLPVIILPVVLIHHTHASSPPLTEQADVTGASKNLSKRLIDLSCYDCGFAVEESQMEDAVVWFCKIYDGVEIGAGVTGNWLYKVPPSNQVSPVNTDQGNISVTYHENPGGTGDECTGVAVPDYGTCLVGMMDIIGDCNIDKKHKQGGWYVDGCYVVTVNPNPLGCLDNL